MNIEHIAMYVTDLEKVKEFFEIYFNGKSNDMYRNKNTGFRSYFISFEEGPRLEIMNKSEVVPIDNHIPHSGFIHIAFSVGSKERVDQLTTRLKEDGYEVLSGPRTTGDGYYESCIVAVEGNQIEITI